MKTEHLCRFSKKNFFQTSVKTIENFLSWIA